jgi:RNA polymerase sigma factor (sigma-70 family)
MAATALGWRTRRSTARPAVGVDDYRLVDRVRAGDDTAFEAIYDRYAPGLLAFCRQLLAGRDEAEDALQNSFGSAYSMLRANDNDVELRPWLYTIARNRCLSLLRARRRDVSLDGAPEPGSGADGLADVVQRRADLRELLEDLRRLPDDQREALVLFEFGGLPHDEIASVLGVRRPKVKALVFQAREGLMRGRRARELPCIEMREQLATLGGRVPSRSMLRRHVDRCPSCALFEAEVGRQRAGLALILPVLPTAGLKAIVLGSALGGGGAAAVAGGGVGAGGGAAVAGGGVGAGGGAATLGGAGGAGLACAGAGGGAAGVVGAAGAGAGAAAGGGAVAGAAAGGVGGALATAGGAGTIAAAFGAKGAAGVVVKLLAVVAVGGGAAGLEATGPPVASDGRAQAIEQTIASGAMTSPVVQQGFAGAGPPRTSMAMDAGSAIMPTAGHDPLPLATAPPGVLPAGTAQAAAVGAVTPATTVGDPAASNVAAPVPAQAPAAGGPAAAPAAPAAPATSAQPMATQAPAAGAGTATSTTPNTTAGGPAGADDATSGTAAPTAAGAGSETPATISGPASGTEPAPAGDRVTNGASDTTPASPASTVPATTAAPASATTPAGR